MTNKIIIISGSLRKASFTTAVCRALVEEMNETQKSSAGNKIEFVLRDYVRELPLYDGDLDVNTDTETPPAAVVDFRKQQLLPNECCAEQRHDVSQILDCGLATSFAW